MFRSAGLGGLLLLLCFAGPANAIVITGLGSYTGTPTAGGPDLTGVVELIINGDIGCSGTLLSDGYSILTAAHCITSSFGSALPTSTVVKFLGASVAVTDTVAAYFVDPSWTGTGSQGGDLAVLRLTNQAPSDATGYSLYTGAMPTSADVVAGYGLGGTGMTGGTTSFGTLLVGANEYVETGSAFETGWSSGLYVGEFYDPNLPSTNALGLVVDPTPYSAADEVDIAHGDSGGPSFYDGQLVGVHDLGICYGSTSCNMPPSVSSSNNSYFGELYADTSVAANATWIEGQEVPEPASAGLFGLGLAALAAFRFRSPSRKSR